jgi:hypothetical protein
MCFDTNPRSVLGNIGQFKILECPGLKPISHITVPISTMPTMLAPKMADVVDFARMTNAHGVSAKIG